MTRYRYYRLRGHSPPAAFTLAYPWVWYTVCVLLGLSTWGFYL
jgi:hypothetical protein